jgi:NAD(P)-dependent dehydrogenase (short-subunit alcohol dehydrogenase family)
MRITAQLEGPATRPVADSRASGAEGPRLLVAGGCGGIGRALVAAARAQGARVAVLDLPASIERPSVEPAQRLPNDGVALTARST